MPRESNVGACLTADLPAEPIPASERLGEDHRPFADLAANTPLVRRLRALEPALGEDGLPVPDAIARAEAAVDGPHLSGALGGRRGLVLVELGAALDTGWVELCHPPRAIVSNLVGGREWPRVHDHPLAPWGEILAPLLLSGCLTELATAPGWLDEQLLILPPLLLQRLVTRDEPVDVAALVDALAGEVAEAAEGEPGVAAPPRGQLVKRVAAACALLVELGAARWDRQDGRLGELAITQLGFFAWLLVIVNVDGEPPPSVDRMLRDAGYLKADGGYIAPEHIPVPVSDN